MFSSEVKGGTTSRFCQELNDYTSLFYQKKASFSSLFCQKQVGKSWAVEHLGESFEFFIEVKSRG